MILAGLILGHREWWIPALIAMAVAAVILIGVYRRLAVESRWFTAGAVLKCLAIGLLAFFLTEPLWSSQRARPGANVRPGARTGTWLDRSMGGSVRRAGGV